MKKWLIVQAYWYFDEITGEFHYRVKQPSLGLQETGKFDVLNVHIFHPFFPYLAEIADLLILHLLPDAEVTSIIQYRKSKGLPTLFEIADNFLEVGPWVAAHDAHRNPEMRQNLLYHASICDGLQLNTTRLQEQFGSINSSTYLLENQMDTVEPCFKAEETFTLGWGGSIGHKTDLLHIREHLKGFLDSHKQSRFAYMGQRALFDELFSDFPRDQTSYTEAGPIKDYYQFLKQVDLGIAPMLKTGFNYCRSDVKHLEFAAFGAGSLLSSAPAYTEYWTENETAFFFENPEMFTSKLEFLFANRQLIRSAAEKSIQHIKKARWWTQQAEKRAEIYSAIIQSEPQDRDVPQLPVPSGIMNCVRVGIFHMEQHDYSKSMEFFDQAVGQLPSYHQAQFWRRELLLRMGRAAEVLKSAESYTPCPSYEQLLIQQLCAAAKTVKPEKFELLLNNVHDPNQIFKLAPERFTPLEMLQLNPFHVASLKQLAFTSLLENKIQPAWKTYFETGLKLDPYDQDFKICLSGIKE